MKKLVCIVLCVMAFIVPSFAQGSAEQTKTVSICTPYMSSVTTKQMVDIIKSELEAQGIKVSIFDSANDNSKFASDIETSVVSKTDAIVIVSIDPNLCKAQIQEAADAKIPVFGCDSGYIDIMQMNATSDNYAMGEAIIKYLFNLMGNKGTLVHLTYRAHPGVVKRTLALEALLPQYPEIKELSEFHCDVPNQINNAKEIVENLLTAYPQKGSINAIFCAWDEPAIGATQALMEAGRDEVIVVGVDGNEQAVKLIKQGTNLKATMAQNFEGMAKLVASDVGKVLKGEATEKGEKYVPAILIEK
jgi:ribose transport system substrate-binding protein